MNKAELIDSIAQKIETTKKEAGTFMDALFDTIQGELAKGEKVILGSFGTFQVNESAARDGRNPQTGETIRIKARKRPVFKPAKALKDAVQTA